MMYHDITDKKYCSNPVFEMDYGVNESGIWEIEVKRKIDNSTQVKRSYEGYKSYYEDLIYYRQRFQL